MNFMEVEGVKQAAESKDASKKITIGLWEFQIANPENHASFQVDVTMDPGQDWVCIVGGATGNPQPGNFLTMYRLARHQRQGGLEGLDSCHEGS